MPVRNSPCIEPMGNLGLWVAESAADLGVGRRT